MFQFKSVFLTTTAALLTLANTTHAQTTSSPIDDPVVKQLRVLFQTAKQPTKGDVNEQTYTCSRRSVWNGKSETTNYRLALLLSGEQFVTRSNFEQNDQIILAATGKEVSGSNPKLLSTNFEQVIVSYRIDSAGALIEEVAAEMNAPLPPVSEFGIESSSSIWGVLSYAYCKPVRKIDRSIRIENSLSNELSLNLTLELTRLGYKPSQEGTSTAFTLRFEKKEVSRILPDRSQDFEISVFFEKKSESGKNEIVSQKNFRYNSRDLIETPREQLQSIVNWVHSGAVPKI